MPDTTAPGETDLPEDVRILLRTRIETYEQIEILRILQRNPERQWSDAELGEQTHVALSLVETAIESLRSAGLVQRSPAAGGERSQYSPVTPEIRSSAEKLLMEYQERPLRIIQLITAHAIERVRTAALRAFADAFVLKKDGDRG